MHYHLGIGIVYTKYTKLFGQKLQFPLSNSTTAAFSHKIVRSLSAIQNNEFCIKICFLLQRNNLNLSGH